MSRKILHKAVFHHTEVEWHSWNSLSKKNQKMFQEQQIVESDREEQNDTRYITIFHVALSEILKSMVQHESSDTFSQQSWTSCWMVEGMI